MTPGHARLILLHQRGHSLSQIARDLRQDLAWVSRVNAGQRRAARVEQAIARALGLHWNQAFPEHRRRIRKVEVEVRALGAVLSAAGKS